MEYRINDSLNLKDIIELYNDVGWTFYTQDERKLFSALKKSLCVISAWENNRLIGLIRVVGDDETIIYIQDILVLQEYQRQGVGKELVKIMLCHFHHVRQKVLLTDKTEKTIGFYSSLGFSLVEVGNMASFFRFDNPPK